MDSSDLQHQQYNHHFQDFHQRQFQHHQKPQTINTGLTRFRSAPSSYLASLIDSSPTPVPTTTATTTNINSEDFLQPRAFSPETETIFARFLQNVSGGSDGVVERARKLCDIPEMSAVGQEEFMGTLKHETEQIQQCYDSVNNHNGSSGYNLTCLNSSSQMVYQSQPSSNKPPLVGGAGAGGDGNLSSLGMECLFSPAQMKIGGGFGGGIKNNSTLTRHRSSPAGLFNDIHIENGYVVSGLTGNYGVGSGNRGNSNEEPSLFSSSISRGGRMDLRPPPSPSTGMLTNSDHVGSRSVGINGLRDSNRFNPITTTTTTDDSSTYLSGFPIVSWDDPSLFHEQLSGSERGEGDLKPSENQIGKGRNRPPGPLAHHLSLPKACLEKLLQFQDTVPCKIRAKRGCATHPRSIAERVRRTRISERMRKLQDLVPNMDKQTNTADMLDLAVEYINDLQNQVKELTSKRARCICMEGVKAKAF